MVMRRPAKPFIGSSILPLPSIPSIPSKELKLVTKYEVDHDASQSWGIQHITCLGKRKIRNISFSYKHCLRCGKKFPSGLIKKRDFLNLFIKTMN